MTHDEAKMRVLAIREAAGDYETAHSMEDELYLDFVRHIASGQSQYRAVAEEILKTRKFDFARHCA